MRKERRFMTPEDKIKIKQNQRGKQQEKFADSIIRLLIEKAMLETEDIVGQSQMRMDEDGFQLNQRYSRFPWFACDIELGLKGQEQVLLQEKIAMGLINKVGMNSKLYQEFRSCCKNITERQLAYEVASIDENRMKKIEIAQENKKELQELNDHIALQPKENQLPTIREFSVARTTANLISDKIELYRQEHQIESFRKK